MVTPAWSHQPTSGEGARQRGGRFNQPGIAALYTSTRSETAVLEYRASLPHRPGTLIAYEVDHAGILDLVTPGTDEAAAFRSRLDGARDWMTQSIRGEIPDTQRVADELIAKGVGGIMAPSYATGAGNDDINIVFWNWSPAPPTMVSVLDPRSDLPVNRDSWPKQ